MSYKYADMVRDGFGPLPLQTYTVRFLEAAVGEVKSTGEPAILTKLEIVAPHVISVNGQQWNIAGRTFKPGPQKLDIADGRNGLGPFLDKLRASGFDMSLVSDPTGESFEPEKIGNIVGHMVDMKLQTEEGFKTRPPTDEERASGITRPQPLLDGAGEKISTGHWVRAWLTDIVGPATQTL